MTLAYIAFLRLDCHKLIERTQRLLIYPSMTTRDQMELHPLFATDLMGESASFRPFRVKRPRDRSSY